MKLENKSVLVVGLGRSGVAAAEILRCRKARVTVCDLKSADEIGIDSSILQRAGIEIYIGAYPEVSRENYDLLIASPGIPLNIQPFRQAFDQGIPVIGELELAYRLKKEQTELLAITGTNGKTTTTALLQDIFARAGRNSFSAGNIGIALTTLVDEVESAVIAVEVSSFQLETVVDFKPHICGILNITPDHLDRHQTMQAYIEAKAKVFQQQDSEDYAVFNYEDSNLRELGPSCPARLFYFSADQSLPEGAFVEDNYLVIMVNERQERICSLDSIRLRGKHNQENILCAAMMAYLAGAPAPIIAEALTHFKGVRHRLEEVCCENNILYINDSKATNPESAIKALESFDNPIILIAGGRNKGSSFDQLALLISRKVKELVLLGEAKEQIKQSVMDVNYKNIHEVETFAEAVRTAQKLAEAGDVVLLSPACASWDMFPSYEHRGDLFCQLVQSINKDVR
ncbi:MAG: UDP-N-acetylmuramoyl-L-alanine--D-glutamate ligase [Syntrophomonadaceae bacterium]|nr:UDP-N-acetylmuramoyl-L-alanine--D-glutamate ligase [Syntrophomonadaceae bacterium]